MGSFGVKVQHFPLTLLVVLTTLSLTLHVSVIGKCVTMSSCALSFKLCSRLLMQKNDNADDDNDDDE